MFLILNVLLFMLNAVAERKLISSNSMKLKDSLTARASVGLSNGCSGTLISSNIVYTAAHCVYGGKSFSVLHDSAPGVSYKAKAVYVPEKYKKGADANKSVEDLCNTSQCDNTCVKNVYLMAQYYRNMDYALILLENHVPICVATDPTSPVAATVGYRPMSENGMIYNPASQNSECFVAGYGATEKEAEGTINLAVVRRFEGLTESTCGIVTAKGVYTRFHNSSADNGFETNICKGDSGSGIQCISNGGKTVQVLGVNIEAWARSMRVKRENINVHLCRKPHHSVSLSTLDHVEDLYNVIVEWKELENVHSSERKCESFLQQHPYTSVMVNYLNRTAEFN